MHTAYKHSIIMLQETHSCPESEDMWRSEWGGRIAFAHGSDTAQAGVAIMFPPGYANNVTEQYSDESHIVCLEVGSTE